MGWPTYDETSHAELVRARADVPTSQVFSQRGLSPDMDPKGVRIRESRDSELHPESIGIIFALDETGSMANIPVQLARQELPRFMSVVMQFVRDPQVMFMAIGDAEQGNGREVGPLQVGQFESDGQSMDKWLTAIYLEGKGGGNTGESYDLAFYFAARHTSLDCVEKRGKKGYLFLTGDEPHLDSVKAEVVRRICGDRLRKDIPMADIVAEVRKTYHPFFLIPDQGRRRNCEECWREVLGDNVICLDRPEDICVASGVLVGLTEGTLVDMDAVRKKLAAINVDPRQIERIVKAVKPYADTLPARATSRRPAVKEDAPAVRPRKPSFKE